MGRRFDATPEDVMNEDGVSIRLEQAMNRYIKADACRFGMDGWCMIERKSEYG